MTFSTIVRRSHMYLALFLFPWMLMYAASTMAMNHRALFAPPAGSGPPIYVTEREAVYDGPVPDHVEPREVSPRILAAVGLDGAHSASRRKDGAIVIARHDLRAPRRVIYTPADRRLIVERMASRPAAMLERFHRRRGYATGYPLDTAWAVSVDLVIVAMIFWALSGLWMWWEMKVTRRLGALAIAGGLALFAFYLLTI